MVRHLALLSSLLVPMSLAACGGGEKKPAKKPVSTEKAPPPKKETEEDREAKRQKAAHAIVPDGSNCLPVALKEPGAPRLQLAAIGADAILCAVDTDETRLLGPVGCWKVDLAAGTLAYQTPSAIPGRGMSVALDGSCARGYCLPKGAKTPASKIVHMAWSGDGAKVAVLSGDDLHVFAAASKAHEKSFSIRGDKGVTNDPSAVHWVGDALFVEGADQGPFSAVWGFKVDGTPIGPIEAIGSKDGKPLSTFGGSFSLLDGKRVAVAEQGFSTVTIFEVSTGQRAKLVRKLTKPPCKAEELTAYWSENEGVGPKCKDHMEKNFGHLVGATAVAGSKNFLVLLRGARLGELGVLDAKTLAEKKAIKLPWCAADAGGGGGASGAEEADALKTKKDAKSTTRGAAEKKAGGDEDPDAGGE